MQKSVRPIGAFTLVQLHYFAVCAEHGSMTRAACALHVSQSTLSAAIGQLEDGIGVELFVRAPGRPLILTATGRRFLGQARTLLANASELLTYGHEAGTGLSGELRVGCFETLAPFYLPSIVSQFSTLYPNVALQFVEGDLEALHSELLLGGCEVALLYGWGLPHALVMKEQKHCLPYVIVGPGHHLARRRGVHLDEIASEPMILLDMPGSSGYFEMVLALLGSELNIRHRSSNYETVRSLVSAGEGLAILNQRPIGDHTYNGGRVHALMILDEDVPTVPIGVAHTRGGRLTRKAQAFVSVCETILNTATSSTRLQQSERTRR